MSQLIMSPKIDKTNYKMKNNRDNNYFDILDKLLDFNTFRCTNNFPPFDKSWRHQ